ncbi:MAG: PD-(D/E)XK nuclease family protein, partial [Angelakisella sp.]
DGTNLVVNGKIDRVDLFANGEERYVRVVDYKSGGKEFNLDEVFYGLNMQMLLYLFALCNDQSAFGKVQPAGILYMPGNLSAAEAPPGADTQLIRSLLDDTLKMKGLLLEDETVLRAMERELAGKFIPVKANKSGGLGDSAKVKSAAEFAQLKDTVTGKVAEMGEALISGGVEPMPIHSRGLNPCDYCDYGVLCGNRNTKRFRAITAAAGTEEMAGDDNG